MYKLGSITKILHISILKAQKIIPSVIPLNVQTNYEITLSSVPSLLIHYKHA